MKYLKVFTDFDEVMNPLSDAEKGRLFVAMLKYAAEGTEPDFRGNERYIWPAAKLNIDREKEYCSRQQSNGAKGGRPKTHQNPEEPTETQENPLKPKKTKKSQKDKDKEKNNISFSGEKEKNAHARGEYKNVFLTDEEYGKLCEKYRDADARIERLSEYIASSGKKYKSHYATICAWARKDAEQKATEKGGKLPSYTLELWERELNAF